MELKQNDLEHIKDILQKGEITLEQAHVMMVMARRIMLVTSKVPSNVRKALNAAVKTCELGHVKKDGLKPEAYYNKTFEYLVAGERNAHARSVLTALAGICC